MQINMYVMFFTNEHIGSKIMVQHSSFQVKETLYCRSPMSATESGMRQPLSMRPWLEDTPVLYYNTTVVVRVVIVICIESASWQRTRTTLSQKT